MGLLAVGSVRALAAVVGLDGEAVLPLALTVQGLLRADQALPGGPVQHHRLKLDRAGARRPVVHPEPADLPWESEEEEEEDDEAATVDQDNVL